MPTFRKIGHDKQYKFNEEAQEKLDSADAALVQWPPAMERARNLLQEGQKLIFVSQKKIWIADRSENGWAIVKECEEDKLEKKRLSRAEARAGRIKKQKLNSKNSNGRGKGQPPSGATRVLVSVLPSTPLGGARGELVQATVLFHNLVSPMRQNSTSSAVGTLFYVRQDWAVMPIVTRSRISNCSPSTFGAWAVSAHGPLPGIIQYLKCITIILCLCYRDVFLQPTASIAYKGR